MIYRFKIISDEKDNFLREIEIDSEANFLQLRNVILESVDYKKNDDISFFLCDDDWTFEEQISLDDNGFYIDKDIWLMEDTPLDELIEDEGQKLVLMFDTDNERCFYMELREIITGRTMHDPLCTRKEGKAPLQKKVEKLPEASKKVKENSTLEDFDLNFYGDTNFNEDELPEEIGEF